jgi:hypothetical protein
MLRQSKANTRHGLMQIDCQTIDYQNLPENFTEILSISVISRYLMAGVAIPVLNFFFKRIPPQA